MEGFTAGCRDSKRVIQNATYVYPNDLHDLLVAPTSDFSTEFQKLLVIGIGSTFRSPSLATSSCSKSRLSNVKQMARASDLRFMFVSLERYSKIFETGRPLARFVVDISVFAGESKKAVSKLSESENNSTRRYKFDIPSRLWSAESDPDKGY